MNKVTLKKQTAFSYCLPSPASCRDRTLNFTP
ncbi:hypothetical protein EYQ97_09280 [Anaerostipes caccae L1-92]|nr:hypothetical protein EYQ97_09280 [Anaerostipes caccae L1-92]